MFVFQTNVCTWSLALRDTLHVCVRLGVVCFRHCWLSRNRNTHAVIQSLFQMSHHWYHLLCSCPVISAFQMTWVTFSVLSTRFICESEQWSELPRRGKRAAYRSTGDITWVKGESKMSLTCRGGVLFLLRSEQVYESMRLWTAAACVRVSVDNNTTLSTSSPSPVTNGDRPASCSHSSSCSPSDTHT